MHLLNHKSSTEKRERPDYNGAVTALTDAEWQQLADRRAAEARDWVLVIDGQVRHECDDWTISRGAFYLNTLAGKHVVFTSAADHADYLRRVAEAVLGS